MKATSGVSLADRLREDWYRIRLSWWMQDYPQREYRRIAKDLRQQTFEAAADVGMRRALRDLGHPRVLAEQYIGELHRPLPRWFTGSVAAGLVFLGIFLWFSAYAIGTFDTLTVVGVDSVTRYPLGAEVVFTHSATTLSVESTLGWPVLLFYAVPMAVAFLLGSRIWRLRRD